MPSLPRDWLGEIVAGRVDQPVPTGRYLKDPPVIGRVIASAPRDGGSHKRWYIIMTGEGCSHSFLEYELSAATPEERCAYFAALLAS